VSRAATAPGPVLAPRVVAALERAARVGGVITAAVGVVVLAGWAFDVSILRRVHPSFASMKANAAIACVLAGTALLMHRTQNARRALSGGVSLIGTLTLVEYLPGVDLGIDELLFSDEEISLAPGRMSPATAANFVLIGFALMTFDTKLRRELYPAEWLALAAGALAMIALLGNLYGVPALYTIGEYEEVALHPAVTLVICCGSILFAAPARGLMRVVSQEGPAGSLARRLLPAAILVPSITGGLLYGGERLGFYDVEHETALFAASSIFAFSGVVWWTASALSRVDVARRAAEHAVREREEDLATTLDSIGDAVIATDEAGLVTRMNPVAERLTGWPIADARERHLDEIFRIVSEATGEQVESPVARVLRDGVVVGLANHTALISRHGETRAIADSGAPIRDGGTLRGVVLVFRDITDERRERSERERAEQALRSAEQQLRHSQKMEAVGRLAGGIAHDFNNLLTVIISYGTMLVRRLPADDPRAKDIGEMVRAGHRAAELTRQLLAFSRRQVLQPSVVDLAQVVAGMSNMIRRTIGEDVELALVTPAPVDPVYVDPGQIEQVILNLVVNARDAMPRGGRITIETGVGIEPDRYVRMTVRDTGEGMDEETLSHIFEPFFTTKEAGKGTGLGLSTVMGIVEQSGGKIFVESAVGKGTAFEIYLPRHAAPLPDERAPQTARPALRGTETILIAEDDDQVRDLVCTILRTHGYTVLEATNAGDALLICEQHDGPIELLLTDVVMPRMSGRQLAERLAPIRPAMRVLFMSGYTGDAMVPPLPFIQKPLEPDALLLKVREVLSSD